MFLLRRPSQGDIDRFLEASRHLPTSYEPIGLLKRPLERGRLDDQVIVIGNGNADFERARLALVRWTQFDIGWVKAFPSQRSADVGTNVAVLIRHLGFWSLNGARVLYHTTNEPHVFGLAYGTLTNHAESGEELFEVALDPKTGDVTYRIRAVSWPQSMLAALGQPIVRALQARFRRDSARAMQRAVRGATGL